MNKYYKDDVQVILNLRDAWRYTLENIDEPFTLDFACKVNENIIEGALDYYVWAMRSQLFWDGNKRTSNICANKLLIENGRGILMVKEKHLNEFHIHLSAFYESNDSKHLKRFLYDKCLYGIDFEKQHKRNVKKDMDFDI